MRDDGDIGPCKWRLSSNAGATAATQLQEQAWTWAVRLVPVATAARLGDYFQYVIDQPVNLGRQKSALLPIINKDVEATRVSHL